MVAHFFRGKSISTVRFSTFRLSIFKSVPDIGLPGLQKASQQLVFPLNGT
jgi:hypothetical protein